MIATRDRVWHPYTRHGAAAEPIAIKSAAGAYLFTEDGRRLFDAISSWWVNLHGHAEPSIAAAVAAQAAALEQVIFAGFTHSPAEKLAEKLVALAPKGLEHVFFSDDGSTAVEAALKMALGCRHHRGEDRPIVAALEHAYHGDTFGAMSVSARGAFTHPYERLLFSVERLPFPEAGAEARTLEAFERLLAAEKGRVAALIVEPLVLGAGGMKIYGAATLRALRELCTRHGVFLIADEVMTGFGRTGTMFACEQAGISPDLMCLSKGITGGFLPMGVTLATPEIFEGFRSSDRAKAFFHGHSYTANPIACAAAVANLDLFSREPVFDRISAIGAAHELGLARLAGRPQVAAMRRLGTIAAVELRVPDGGYLSALGPRLYDYYLSRGVLLRPLGSVVYVLPPYCSTEEDLSHVYDAIEESLSLIAGETAAFEAPVAELLGGLCADAPRHARFLNTLSLLEHIGSRKILLTRGADADEDALRHLAEETRHAHFFRRAAEKEAGRRLSYRDADTAAASSARMYFGRLDSGVARETGAGVLAYLYVTLAVERRAAWFYGLYERVLRERLHALTLRSVIAEEDAHLSLMESDLRRRDPDFERRLEDFSKIESGLFASWFTRTRKALTPDVRQFES